MMTTAPTTSRNSSGDNTQDTNLITGSDTTYKNTSATLPEKLIDTHCHLNLIVKSAFDRPLTSEEIASAAPVLEQAQLVGVTDMICVGTSLIESQNCVALAYNYPSIYATVGIHPNDAGPDWQTDLKELKKLIITDQTNFTSTPKIIGIGECGIDFHYPEYNSQRQKDVFKAQIELALEYHLPLVIHTRDAGDTVLTILDQFSNEFTRPLTQSPRGVMHCFSESLDYAQESFKRGFFLGIGGTVTYPKNNALREVITALTESAIVLETDAPYLPVQTMRGKKNSPVYLPLIAQYIAELLTIPLEHVAHATTQNASALFQLKKNGGIFLDFLSIPVINLLYTCYIL